MRNICFGLPVFSRSGIVLWSDENKIEPMKVQIQFVKFGGRKSTMAQHTYCGAWGQKHHALGQFFCKEDRTIGMKTKNEWGYVL